MAPKKLMDITLTSSLFLLLLLVPATGARYVSGGAIETQAGIMPIDGVSPVPTEAPGLNGIPNELRRRAIAPSSWCGMFDGNYGDILSCAPYTSCVLKNNFYPACCNSLNTDLCFIPFNLPTTCFDYSIYTKYNYFGSLTVRCSNPNSPYCFTVTSYGLSPQFACTNTIYPRIHSFVPAAAYFSSSVTPSITRPYTSPARTSTTTIPDYRTPVSTSDDDSDFSGKKKFKLPPSAKAGIGTGVSLVTVAVIALFAICFRRKRKRAHVSPTDGGAGPGMAQTNNPPQGYQNQPQPQGYQGAAQPVRQQYQPQPQGFQNSTQPIQQYQPQLGNTNFPDSADIPPYTPAPVYTSGSQNISVAPIPPNDPTRDTKIASTYPIATVTPVPPLSPNPSQQTHQQQHNTGPAWDYPPNSPISTLGPERSDLHHQDIPPSHSELGIGDAGAQHQDIPPSHSELGIGDAGAQHQTGTPWNHSELPGAGEARAHYPGPPNNNHSELGP